jgi:uncharacterized protein YfkK (UPF0435 family)
MSENLTYHIKLFNDKVRVLNQTSGKTLTLTAQEARSLHNDIYDLLSTIAELSKNGGSNNDSISINMDGGRF